MGIEFRGSRYIRDVSLGKRTVKDGEAVAVWNRLGVHRQVTGPALVRLFYSTIRFLDRYTAGPNEYLRISRRDGTMEYKRGPFSMFENPVDHVSVRVCQAHILESPCHCLVVSREIPQGTDIAHHGDETSSLLTKKGALLEETNTHTTIVKGPSLFFPEVGDVITEFSWHGYTSPDQYILEAGKDKFQILNTATRHWKVDTALNINDSVRGTVNLTITFGITNVMQMLSHTSDVTGSLYDSLVIDLHTFASSSMADEISSINELSRSRVFESMQSFPRLQEIAGRIGVEIASISFRGFEPSRSLQKHLSEVTEMHNKLQRDRLVAEQAELQLQADLMSQKARLEQEKELKQAQLETQRESLAAEEAYRREQLQFASSRDSERFRAEMQQVQAVNDESLRVLRGLAEAGVDLTKLLSSRPLPSHLSGGKMEKKCVGAMLLAQHAPDMFCNPDLFHDGEEKEE